MTQQQQTDSTEIIPKFLGMPMRWELRKIVTNFWNPEDDILFPRKHFWHRLGRQRLCRSQEARRHPRQSVRGERRGRRPAEPVGVDNRAMPPHR